jgi:hypothetical protein
LADLMLTLEQYLRGGQRVSFEWGVNDGATWIADWARDQGHRDPLARWRGYRSQREAERIVAANGGLEALARKAFAGLREIAPEDATTGDIALGCLGADPAFPPCGLIRAGAFWAGLTAPRGVLLAPAASIVLAWRV